MGYNDDDDSDDDGGDDNLYKEILSYGLAAFHLSDTFALTSHMLHLIVVATAGISYMIACHCYGLLSEAHLG